MQVGWDKIVDFGAVSRGISGTVQDRNIVTVKDLYVLCQIIDLE